MLPSVSVASWAFFTIFNMIHYKFKSAAIFIFLVTLLFLAVTRIFAQNLPAGSQGNNLSDYQFQLDQYRTNYAEYQILKNDYQTNPTLNNEQKAVLSAKRTIASRELTLAYFTLVMIDSLKATGVDFPLVNSAMADLNTIGQFHFKESQDAANINTKADLSKFTADYLTATGLQEDNLARAQVALKIAKLIQIQNDAKRAYDSISATLQTQTDEPNVQNGIGQIQSYSQQINDQITALAQKATTTNLVTSNLSQFFDDSTAALVQIRALQSRLVNIIIELDTNYVQH